MVLTLVAATESSNTLVAADPPPTSTPRTQPLPVNSDGLAPLNPQGTILLDPKRKIVVVQAEVVLREGMLEMLLCLKRTKEHESIFAVDGSAWTIHAGLLAAGAEAGSPVKFHPDYVPATGQEIEILVSWPERDAAGKLVPGKKIKAQTLVRRVTRRFFAAKLPKLPKGVVLPDEGEARWIESRQELMWYGTMTDAQRDRLLKLSADKPYQEAVRSLHEQTRIQELDHRWVFGGSGFYAEPVVDPKTGKEEVQQRYKAETGDVICVANFATAMLDLPVESSAEADGLNFEAYTERLPPVGTKVTIELIPVTEKRDSAPAPAPEKSK